MYIKKSLDYTYEAYKTLNSESLEIYKLLVWLNLSIKTTTKNNQKIIQEEVFPLVILKSKSILIITIIIRISMIKQKEIIKRQYHTMLTKTNQIEIYKDTRNKLKLNIGHYTLCISLLIQQRLHRVSVETHHSFQKAIDILIVMIIYSAAYKWIVNTLQIKSSYAYH